MTDQPNDKRQTLTGADEALPARLRSSVKNLHELARNLGEVPAQLRETPHRAAERPPRRMPGGESQRLAKLGRALAWPSAVLLLSAGAGTAIVLVSRF